MRRHQGDTIIEVILAVTIFSLVAVGAMSIMNNGIAMAQRSLEITLVRQQIDAQAEILRYISSNEDYADRWSSLKTNNINTAAESVLNVSTCPRSDQLGGWFVWRPDTMTMVSGANYNSTPETYAQVRGGTSEGLSVQLVAVEGGGAYDAYIQACWDGLGTSQPMTMGTIVRLYDA